MCRTPAFSAARNICEALGVIHGDGFFAQDMFARRNRRQRDGRMEKIRRGNDDGVYIRPRQQILVIGKGGRDARLLRWRCCSTAGLVSHNAVSFASGHNASPGRWFCKTIPPQPMIPTPIWFIVIIIKFQGRNDKFQ